jgi:amidohydrolase
MELREDLSTLLIHVRRHLHMNPEVGFQEHETARYIREVLEIHGLEALPMADTGLAVEIRGAHPGRAVGYRADIDALPIQDRKPVSYASRIPGVAHLCGHDAHTAVGIGVALLLHRLREDLYGTVRVFFQPCEEGVPSGAPRMIEAGVLDGLEAVYAVHVDPTLDTGRYGLISGAATASADLFRIQVDGPSTGHSARPHQVVDTVWVATQIIQTLYQLVGRITDSRNAAVLTVCQFQGGEAVNVIPQTVTFGGTLRCTEQADRERLQKYLQETAMRIGALHGATVAVQFEHGAPPVINDPRLVAHVAKTLLTDHDEAALYQIPRPSMGAEDFAHYQQHIPGVLVRVGTANGPATRHPLHDACFDLDEAALAPTARLMAQVLLHHLRPAFTVAAE